MTAAATGGGVDLTDQTGAGGVEWERAAGERFALGGGDVVEGVDDLEAGGEGVDAHRVGDRVDRADRPLDVDRHPGRRRPHFQQADASLAEAGVAGDGEDERPRTRQGGIEHPPGDGVVERLEIALSLVEVVAGGHPRVGEEVVESRVDRRPEDDPGGGVERPLGGDGPQAGVAGAETDDGDARRIRRLSHGRPRPGRRRRSG